MRSCDGAGVVAAAAATAAADTGRRDRRRPRRSASEPERYQHSDRGVSIEVMGSQRVAERVRTAVWSAIALRFGTMSKGQGYRWQCRRSQAITAIVGTGPAFAFAPAAARFGAAS